MLHAHGRQRYLPPPPLSNSQQNIRASREDVSSNYGNNAAERRLDDMHDWAIYRTNANSRYVDGGLHKAKSMPFGEFYLDTKTADSLHNDARHGPHHGSSLALNHDPSMYIEFGLPRLPTQQPSRARMSRAWSAANIQDVGIHEGHGGPDARFGYSSSDIRDADVDFSSKYSLHKGLSREAIVEERDDSFPLYQNRRTFYENRDNRSNVGSRYGIDNLAYSREDVREGMPGYWDAQTDFTQNGRRRYNEELISALNPNLKQTDGYYKLSGSTLALATADHPANYKRPPTENERYFYEQQRNKEYATREWKGYYSSMEELRANPYPHIQLLGVSYEGKQKKTSGYTQMPKRQRVLENISFEVHGGEILAVLGHRGKPCLSL